MRTFFKSTLLAALLGCSFISTSDAACPNFGSASLANIAKASQNQKGRTLYVDHTTGIVYQVSMRLDYARLGFDRGLGGVDFSGMGITRRFDPTRVSLSPSSRFTKSGACSYQVSGPGLPQAMTMGVFFTQIGNLPRGQIPGINQQGNNPYNNPPQSTQKQQIGNLLGQILGRL